MCRPILLPVVGIVVALTASSLGYVGVTDPCPIPTPCPPPGAPWGVVNNPNMEDGFTNGGANQWVAWKDSVWAGQIHYAGTDRKYDGSYSQKLVFPLPPRDNSEAGIYQQIYVVPGASYTVTAQIQVSFAPQTYNGEDILAWLGVDPFGQASGDGYGMVWSSEVATQNTWITKSVTVTAVFPVMTVGLILSVLALIISAIVWGFGANSCADHASARSGTGSDRSRNTDTRNDGAESRHQRELRRGIQQRRLRRLEQVVDQRHGGLEAVTARGQDRRRTLRLLLLAGTGCHECQDDSLLRRYTTARESE